MPFSPALTSCSPNFFDRPSFSVSRNRHEYANYLDYRRFAAMRKSAVTLSILVHNNITGVTSFGAWVKKWLHCRGQMCLSYAM